MSVTTAKGGPGYVSHNYIINGAFDINQRQFTSTTDNLTYTFDRWATRAGAFGTTTVSAETSSLTGLPDEIRNYARIVTAGQTTDALTISGLRQPIEDVSLLANKTITVSFYARAASETPKLGVNLSQVFAADPTVDISFGFVTLNTSWQRYSLTAFVPSIATKSIGAANFNMLAFFTSLGSFFPGIGLPDIGIQNTSIDITGVQLEAGSIATPFKRHAPSLQGELAACQRYYTRLNATGNSHRFANGIAFSTTLTVMVINLPTVMRAVPSVQPSNLSDFNIVGAGGAFVPNGFAQIRPAGSTISTNMGVSGTLTADNLYQLRFQTSTTYLELDSEL